MELKTGSFNMCNFYAPAMHSASSPVFRGKEKIIEEAGSVLSAARKTSTQDGIIGFIKHHFTEGTDVTYTNCRQILTELEQNFGQTFNGCFEEIDFYNSLVKSGAGNKLKNGLSGGGSEIKDKLIYKINKDDTITFHKAPFMKNVLDNVREFTEGTILDLGVSARSLFRKIKGTAGVKSAGFINKALDTRVAQKEAVDSFYRLSGIFEKATEGVDGDVFTRMTKSVSQLESEKSEAISKNIIELAKKSAGKASEKVGKYNTKTERAWNRLGTGFVSAVFASTDFYNISMLENNDPQKANVSGRKRFTQDMRRQSLTAGITYVILGALQKSVNKSIFYAALSLGGVTLISEILSRKIGGIALKPLSPKEAAEAADKRLEKKSKKSKNKGELDLTYKATSKPESAHTPSLTKGGTPVETHAPDSVYNVFTDKINGYIAGKTLIFGALPGIIQTNGVKNTTGTKEPQNAISFAAQNSQTESKEKKSSASSKVLKFMAGAVGLSLTVGFLRTRNVCKIDDTIKSISSKYQSMSKKFTTKPVIVAKEDVEAFMEYLLKNNFNEQHSELAKALGSGLSEGAIKGSSEFIQNNMPACKIDPEGLYYNLGRSNARAKKIIYNVVMYPVNTVSKLMRGGNNIIKTLFGQKHATAKEVSGISRNTAASFIEKYTAKYKKAMNNNDMVCYRKELEDAFTRHFSEANSQNKNTSIAMASRLLITLISSYFFVNDYRNEVLIESRGKDVERANATMRERIGHKVSNFFLNSMFMDLFNTTFENIYLASVPGAVAVAMATEFTNESAVRASICTPRRKMTREELIEYEKTRLEDPGIKGKYYRTFMKYTGKKPLSEKAKD